MRLTSVFIVTFLLSSCNSRKSSNDDFIRIEHIGPSDEQIKIIVISINEIPEEVDWERNFLVTQGQFKSIEEFVSGFCSGNQPVGDKKANEWAVFRIILFQHGATERCTLETQESSI